MLIVHDRVGVAHLGRPSAPYLSLGVRLSHPIDFRKPIGLSWQRSRCLGLSMSRWGRWRAAYARWHLVSHTWCAVVVGHTQTTSRVTRRHFVEQGASNRSGRVPSYPIRIEWGRERVFAPSFHLSPITVPFPTVVPLSLSRRRERAFTPFLCLFLICRLFSSFLLTKSV